MSQAALLTCGQNDGPAHCRKPHDLAHEINKLTDGIARDEKLAGEHLLTLKGSKPLGITWEHYLKECGVKISAVDQLDCYSSERGCSVFVPLGRAPWPSNYVRKGFGTVLLETTFSEPDTKRRLAFEGSGLT